MVEKIIFMLSLAGGARRQVSQRVEGSGIFFARASNPDLQIESKRSTALDIIMESHMGRQTEWQTSQIMMINDKWRHDEAATPHVPHKHS